MERGGPGATNWRDPSTGRFSGCWVCASLMRNKHRRPARVIASRVLRAESSGAVTTSARGAGRQFGPHLHPILPLRHRRLHSPRHRAPPQVPNDLLQSVTYVLGLTVTYVPDRSLSARTQLDWVAASAGRVATYRGETGTRPDARNRGIG